MPGLMDNKVAVVTGGNSGIGRAAAIKFAQAGAKVVIAARRIAEGDQTVERIRAVGGEAIFVKTDVSKCEEVEALAQKTLDVFGAVHLLFNNAGMGTVGDIVKPAWDIPLTDWEQTIAVNLWGVIYGIRVFIPLMLKENTECYIVNTASTAGLVTGAGLGSYSTTKHGVVALSEHLYKALTQAKANIKVSVLCPGGVATPIVDAAVDQWTKKGHSSLQEDLTPEEQEKVEGLSQALKDGMSPEQVADELLEAISEEKFYILTHKGVKDRVRTRMEEILEEGNPTIP